MFKKLKDNLEGAASPSGVKRPQLSEKSKADKLIEAVLSERYLEDKPRAPRTADTPKINLFDSLKEIKVKVNPKYATRKAEPIVEEKQVVIQEEVQPIWVVQAPK
jgi:hypothetical protein